MNMKIKTEQSEVEILKGFSKMKISSNRFCVTTPFKSMLLFIFLVCAKSFSAKASIIVQGDTIKVCSLDFPYTLTANSGLSQYQWNTGSMNDTAVINNAGKYWVSANDNGNIVSDTIIVLSRNIETEIFKTDKAWFCIADTPWFIGSNEIFEPSGFWNTGTKSNVLQISITGKYWYEFIDSTFCIRQIDTVEVIGVSDSTVLNFSKTIALCASSFPYEINVQLGDNPLWQDSSTDFLFYADSAGTYYYESYLSSCAIIYDTITIQDKVFNAPTLCCDTLVCMPDSVALSLPAGFVDYFWSTGQNARSIFIAKEGVFNVWVRVTDSSNCSASTNTIIVELQDSIPKPSIIQNGAFLVVQPAGFTYQWYRNDSLLQGQTTSGIRNVLSGVYCVRVSQGICFDSACYTYINPVGITSIKENELSIYPNPVNDVMRIESKVAFKEIIVSDVHGAIMLRTAFESIIDVSALQAGIYFIHCFNTEGQNYSRKFLKE